MGDALEVGYRFLECAEFYGNEAQVGRAIQRSGIPRKELFLCSKVWTTTIERGPAAIREQLDRTLKDLQTDYLDLYLIHWPVPGHHVEAYKTLEAIMKETPQKIRGIGVSNYALEDLQELTDAGVQEMPLVNQIEINPFLYRQNTIAKCQEMGIVLQSYRYDCTVVVVIVYFFVLFAVRLSCATNCAYSLYFLLLLLNLFFWFCFLRSDRCAMARP